MLSCALCPEHAEWGPALIVTITLSDLKWYWIAPGCFPFLYIVHVQKIKYTKQTFPSPNLRYDKKISLNTFVQDNLKLFCHFPAIIFSTDFSSPGPLEMQPPLEFQGHPGSYLLLQAADLFLILGVILLTARISLLMPLQDATFELHVGLLQGAHLVQVGGQAVVEVLHHRLPISA